MCRYRYRYRYRYIDIEKCYIKMYRNIEMHRNSYFTKMCFLFYFISDTCIF